MNEDLQNTWEKNLNILVKRQFKTYEDITLDLSLARSLELHNLAGDCLVVVGSSHAAAVCDIRLSRQNNDPIAIKRNRQIQTIFTGFYITNEAVADSWLKLRVGIAYKEVKQGGRGAAVRAVVPITNVAADADTQPDYQIADRVVIKADNENTGIVYVDFHTAAVQGSCLTLDPGESITVNIDNLNDIHCNFEVADERAFIVYEV